MAVTTPPAQRSGRQGDRPPLAESSAEIVGVRWEMLMRARDRAVDSSDDGADVLRQVADRLADELSRIHVDSQSRRHAG